MTRLDVLLEKERYILHRCSEEERLYESKTKSVVANGQWKYICWSAHLFEFGQTWFFNSVVGKIIILMELIQSNNMILHNNLSENTLKPNI